MPPVLFTASCLAVSPLIEKTGPVMYCFTPGYVPPSGSYAFSPGVNAGDQVRAFFRYFRERHWTRIAVINTTDATGQANARGFQTNLAQPENKGLNLVASESMGLADISVAAQLERVKAGQPDVLYLGMSGQAFGTVLRGMNDAGLDVPIATSTANMSYAQMQQYQQILPKDVLFSGMRGMSMATTPNGPIRTAQALYFDAFRTIGVRPDGLTQSPWDPAWIVVGALRHLGVDAKAAQLRDYIENLHGWPGINGDYDFRNGDQRGIEENGVVVYRWDSGKLDFVPTSGPGGAAMK